MTKDEWLNRCAVRFMDRAKLTSERAYELAQNTFAAQDDPDFELSEIGEYSPESCADVELEYWRTSHD